MNRMGYAAGMFAASLSAIFATSAQAQSIQHRVGSLVELYTSQGCNSCPPANRLIGQIANREGVVVLTFPVDYWDSLGWKDTFGSHAFTERQQNYAAARGDDQVYTPQVVVNGLTHAVGSQSAAVDSAIATTAARVHAWQPKFDASVDRGMLTVAVGKAPTADDAGHADIWLAQYRRTATVSVKRGENAGSDLTYTNIVRDLVKIGKWDGDAINVAVKLAEQKAGDAGGPFDGGVIFLQKGMSGPVLAAVELGNLKAAGY